MAETTPVMATDADWDNAKIAALAALKGTEFDDDQGRRDIHDRFTVLKARTNLTQVQVQTMTELFAKRKDLALDLARSVNSVGDVAGKSHVELQKKAKDKEIDLTGLGGSLHAENLSKRQQFGISVSGFLDVIAGFCEEFGLSGAAQTCRNLADRLGPKKIDVDVGANSALAAQRTSVTIDSKSASLPTVQVWGNILALSDAEVAGVNGAAGAQVQKNIDKVRDANGTATPSSTPVSAVPPVTSVGSAANVAQLTRDLMALGKTSNVNIPEKVALTIAGAVKQADTDKNGIDKASEAAVLAGSKAVTSLDADQRTILYKHIGLSPEGKIVAPVPGAPAPVLN